MTDYRLTDEEIPPQHNHTSLVGITNQSVIIQTTHKCPRCWYDAASKKARNETIKEVKAWLGACGFHLVNFPNKDILIRTNMPISPDEIFDTNRFFPKEIE